MNNNTESRASKEVRGSIKSNCKVRPLIELFLAYYQETLSVLTMCGRIVKAEVML